jgi:hypothetical protein
MTRDQALTGASPLSADALRQLVDSELSVTARAGHVGLLLISLIMTAAIVSLWATEPALPVRTRVAFAAMTVIGLSWSAFAVHVLTGRRTLYVRHRVMAGRMAVTFTSVFVAGALAAGYFASMTGAYVAGALGAVMLGVAVAMLMGAQRAVARLEARRQALERETRKRA